MTTLITENTYKSSRHTTGYLESGPKDGPLLIFVHGWPELSISWRHQIPVFAGLGFRVVAPDMRGYGRSSTYESTDAFSQEEIVTDMVELLEHLEVQDAVWVGHDWGSPVVWNIASHHPSLCTAVASLCVPYRTLEHSWSETISLVDRDVYPMNDYPVGQWDYQLFYQENLERAIEVFEADTYATVKALFRKGDPNGLGRPAMTASVRTEGGWFGGAEAAPDIPADHDVVTEADLRFYAAALDRNGFFGPDSWYLNHDANETYAATAQNDGRLEMPVLFLHGKYDHVCQTVATNLAEPMREYCSDLTEFTLDTGHWMAQEAPLEVNAALVAWLRASVPDAWPKLTSGG